ncbi:hypothetical protein CI610_01635 [invertebrate metagenome]|uniref:Uncharacterized protein n=1 Tax=invertebrate metagenome TaxID=1711999 RepID=A0A2H9T897_9ZZZZ
MNVFKNGTIPACGMVEEKGVVVAVEPDQHVLIRIHRHNACHYCDASHQCGSRLLLESEKNNAYITAFTEIVVGQGDTVVIGISGNMLVSGTILLYLFPLLLMMFFAWGATALLLSEVWVFLLMVAGLFLSFSVSKIVCPWFYSCFSKEIDQVRVLRKVSEY